MERQRAAANHLFAIMLGFLEKQLPRKLDELRPNLVNGEATMLNRFLRVLSRMKDDLVEAVLQDCQDLASFSKRVELYHDCMFNGCKRLNCEFCKNNLFKNCRNLKDKYFVLRNLNAKCGAVLRAKIVDQENNEQFAVGIENYQFQVFLVPADKILGAVEGDHIFQLLEGAALRTNKKGTPLLLPISKSSKDRAKDALQPRKNNGDGVVVQCQAGGTPLPNLQVTESSEALLGGRMPALCLVVMALDRNGNVLQDIQPAISDKFVVATIKAKNKEQGAPFLDFHVNKVPEVGNETVSKLLDLMPAAEKCVDTLLLQQELRLRFANADGKVEINTVGKLRSLMSIAADNKELKDQLVNVLKINKVNAWERAWEYVQRAVETDNRLRVWYRKPSADENNPKGLVYSCNQAHIDFGKGPIGSADPTGKVTTLDEMNEYQRMEVTELQLKAKDDWQTDGHPNWDVVAGMTADDVKRGNRLTLGGEQPLPSGAPAVQQHSPTHTQPAAPPAEADPLAQQSLPGMTPEDVGRWLAALSPNTAELMALLGSGGSQAGIFPAAALLPQLQSGLLQGVGGSSLAAPAPDAVVPSAPPVAASLAAGWPGMSVGAQGGHPLGTLPAPVAASTQLPAASASLQDIRPASWEQDANVAIVASSPSALSTENTGRGRDSLSKQYPGASFPVHTEQDADNLGMKLVRACEQGHNLECERLLSAGADVNGNMDGRTALSVAASVGYVDICELLIKHGADVNARSKGGVTALMLAAEGNHEFVCRLLLGHGADLSARAQDGRTALMYALSAGSAGVFGFPVSCGADVNALDGKTALMFAGVFNLLLKHTSPADLSKADSDGKTTLMYAACAGSRDVCGKLVACGVDVKAQTLDGRTALMFAVERGYVDVCQKLLEYMSPADVNKADSDGKTTLTYAACAGSKDVCALLVACGADVKAQTLDGRTALMFAAERGYVDVCQLLLGHMSPADVNKADSDGKTALVIAAERGHHAVCQLLIQHSSPQGMKATDLDGSTALVKGEHVGGHQPLVGHSVNVATARKDSSDWFTALQPSDLSSSQRTGRMGSLVLEQQPGPAPSAQTKTKDINALLHSDDEEEADSFPVDPVPARIRNEDAKRPRPASFEQANGGQQTPHHNTAAEVRPAKKPRDEAAGSFTLPPLPSQVPNTSLPRDIAAAPHALTADTVPDIVRFLAGADPAAASLLQMMSVSQGGPGSSSSISSSNTLAAVSGLMGSFASDPAAASLLSQVMGLSQGEQASSSSIFSSSTLAPLPDVMGSFGNTIGGPVPEDVGQLQRSLDLWAKISRMAPTSQSASDPVPAVASLSQPVQGAAASQPATGVPSPLGVNGDVSQEAGEQGGDDDRMQTNGEAYTSVPPSPGTEGMTATFEQPGAWVAYLQAWTVPDPGEVRVTRSAAKGGGVGSSGSIVCALCVELTSGHSFTFGPPGTPRPSARLRVGTRRLVEARVVQTEEHVRSIRLVFEGGAMWECGDTEDKGERADCLAEYFPPGYLKGVEGCTSRLKALRLSVSAEGPLGSEQTPSLPASPKDPIRVSLAGLPPAAMRDGVEQELQVVVTPHKNCPKCKGSNSLLKCYVNGKALVRECGETLVLGIIDERSGRALDETTLARVSWKGEMFHARTNRKEVDQWERVPRASLKFKVTQDGLVRITPILPSTSSFYWYRFEVWAEIDGYHTRKLESSTFQVVSAGAKNKGMSRTGLSDRLTGNNVPGIGLASAKKLTERGVKTVGDLADLWQRMQSDAMEQKRFRKDLNMASNHAWDKFSEFIQELMADVTGSRAASAHGSQVAAERDSDTESDEGHGD